MKTIAMQVLLVLFVSSMSASAQSLDVQRIDPGTMQPNGTARSAPPNAGPSSNPAAVPLPAEPEPAASAVLPAAPPFAGTPRQGLVEIRRLALEGRGAEAAALAGALALNAAQDERLHAELRYAGGVASSIADLPANAAVEFRSAGALAGPGELRLHALYNEAVERIVEAEALRAAITEIEVGDKDAVASAEQHELGSGPDMLPAAREKYVEAKGLLLDRIRMDWRDPDLRANLEFVERRLDELAEIEKKRKGAESQLDSEGRETEKTKEGKGATKGEADSEVEQDEDGKEGNDPHSQEESLDDADPKPGEGAGEGDDMPDPKAEEREGEEQRKQEEAQTGREEEELESEAGGALPDPTMSEQETRLLLDKVNEIDERAKRLRAALYRTRMIEVARDW